MEKIMFAKARDNSDIMIITKDEKQYRMNSAFRPVEEAKRWAKQFSLDFPENTILQFGLGNGLFAESILDRLCERDRLVIFEPSDKVWDVMKNQEDKLTFLGDPRVFLIHPQSIDNQLMDYFQQYIDWKNIGGLKIAIHPEYDHVYSDELKRFVQEVECLISIVNVRAATEAHIGGKLTENMIRNFKYIKDINILRDFCSLIPEDVPAIIVSAGPSLEKNIDELKKAEGKAFILVVDSAVKMVLKHKIAIDAIVSVDVFKNPEHLRVEEARKIPMLCMPHSNSMIMDYHQGRKIYAGSSPLVGKMLVGLGHDLSSYTGGGSVTCDAIGACLTMGFQKIILMGSDLAYLGEVTHTGGVTKHIINEDEDVKYVPGVNGDKVKTRYDWDAYRIWIENLVAVQREVTFFDATEGGALIQGTTCVKLKDVIAKECKKKFAFADWLAGKKATLNDKEYQQICSLWSKCKEELDAIEVAMTSNGIEKSEIPEKYLIGETLIYYVETTFMKDIKEIMIQRRNYSKEGIDTTILEQEIQALFLTGTSKLKEYMKISE